MANTVNMKGTSFPSFTIGKQGITLLQGTVAPIVDQGVNGDMYFQNGTTPALWQKRAGAWAQIGSFSAKISSGTTSVDTAEVAETITLNVKGKRIVNVESIANSANGEHVTIRNGESSVNFVVSDSAGTNPMDMVFTLQGTGALRVVSEGDSVITNSNGAPIVIYPKAKTAGAGAAVNISAGATSEANANGGNIVLSPGTGGAGGQTGQILAPPGYLARNETSIVNRLSLSNLLVAIEASNATHAVAINEHVVIVTRTGASTVVLPTTSVAVGRQIKVKAAAGATVTVSVEGGGNIDAAATVTLNAFEKATYIWTGTQWYSI